MKIAVVSKYKNIRNIPFEKYNLKPSQRPDAVVCIGGDGTLLYGELMFPYVPKLFIKHKCRDGCGHSFDGIFKKISEKKFNVLDFTKIEAVANGDKNKKLVGLNEINIHYKIPCAIGLDLTVNGKKFNNVLGDGMIIATPYGSTAYFHSITRKSFSKGIGIAFNNPVKPIKPLFVGEKSVIKVKIKKGAGLLASDCNQKIIPLKTGDNIIIRAHAKKAKIIRLAGCGLKVGL